MRVNSMNFGCTVAPPVPSCDCQVLPWEDCEHTAWDARKSVDRVVQEAQQATFTFEAPEPPRQTLRTDDPYPVIITSTMVERFRQVASWYEKGNGKRGKIARSLIADLDVILKKNAQLYK